MLSERFTEEARRSLELARRESRGLGHWWVGTEHLLLALCGMFADEEAAGSRALHRLGVRQEDVREAVLRRTPPDGGEVSGGKDEGPAPFTPRMTRVLERSVELASRYGRAPRAGTEHLLLGMFWEPGGIGDRVLGELGVSYREIAERLAEQGSMEGLPDRQEIPAPRREPEYGPEVVVPRRDLGAVLKGLRESLPPGTPLGFNHVDEDRSWIRAGRDVDLEGEVGRILGEAGKDTS